MFRKNVWNVFERVEDVGTCFDFLKVWKSVWKRGRHNFGTLEKCFGNVFRKRVGQVGQVIVGKTFGFFCERLSLDKCLETCLNVWESRWHIFRGGLIPVAASAYY